ncbi:uncharacterized protein L201_002876 [Kwoniella dendrophila CBS 6074]|uniref:Ubiquitin 3 binding protein But2 C-terminal domain-containing protein n=1 Tax=Kwoniella dendrophila CBS 6074 TaxID=1295534 RepID=A0AAX4JRP0_9TREE
MLPTSLVFFVSVIHTISISAAPIPTPGPVETGGGLKQATRDEIIARYSKSLKRALPSPTPPPREVHTGEPVYTLYYQGSGLIENDDNPGNQGFDPSPSTITISGTTPQNSAIKRCADHTASLQDEYFSFQLYYDQPSVGDGQWICTSYYNENTDTSYFNVKTPTAGPVFGYSVVN